MKIKLLVNIDFEYSGTPKTRFAAGRTFTAYKAFKYKFNDRSQVFEETEEVEGYWIGDERGRKPNPPCDAPGSLIRTKCFVNECEVLDD